VPASPSRKFHAVFAPARMTKFAFPQEREMDAYDAQCRWLNPEAAWKRNAKIDPLQPARTIMSLL